MDAPGPGLEPPRAHERDRAEHALRDEFLRLQRARRLPRLVAELEHHLALLAARRASASPPPACARNPFSQSLELALYSEILAVIIGIRVGVISAVNRNKPKDTTIRIIALVGVSVPVFFLGLLFQYYFGYVLGILPVGGFKNDIFRRSSNNY